MHHAQQEQLLGPVTVHGIAVQELLPMHSSKCVEPKNERAAHQLA